MQEAESLMATCYAMYSRMPTGLSPELVYFDDFPGQDFTVRVSSRLTFFSVIFHRLNTLMNNLFSIPTVFGITVFISYTDWKS